MCCYCLLIWYLVLYQLRSTMIQVQENDWSEFLDKEIKIKDCLSWNKKTRLMLEIVHVHRWLIVMLEKYIGNLKLVSENIERFPVRQKPVKFILLSWGNRLNLHLYSDCYWTFRLQAVQKGYIPLYSIYRTVLFIKINGLSTADIVFFKPLLIKKRTLQPNL